jgi:hypothetical protein
LSVADHAPATPATPGCCPAARASAVCRGQYRPSGTNRGRLTTPLRLSFRVVYRRAGSEPHVALAAPGVEVSVAVSTLGDRDADRRAAVENGDTNLELCHLTVEGSRHAALTQQFRFADIRFTHCVLVSTRLPRWQPLYRRQSARPRCLEADRTSFRAITPAVAVFHGLAFLRGRRTAWAPSSAMASWHFLYRRHQLL